ncbi:hypothetical protein GCM10022247_56680 [Allokutzneria multivorans]|uniref:Transcriptional regulator n=1 Tax=Allokutzneria multivorans TaxID=1142134 RepID=A0ABP7TEC0_9PSEU
MARLAFEQTQSDEVVAVAQPNDLLRAARERRPSRLAPGEPMSRQELAQAVNEWLWTTTGRRYELDAHAVARWERGAVRWPQAQYRSALRHVLGVNSDTALGFRPASRGRPVPLPPVAVAPSINGTDLGVSPTEFVARINLETPAPARIGSTEVEQVRATTRALAMSENLHGGGLAAEAASAQLRWATRLLDARADNRTRAGIFEAVGNLAGVVAFAAFDIGDHTAANNCFRFGLWCAEQGGSWELRAATLADMARQAVYVGDLDSALTLIEHAQVRMDRLTATTQAMVSMVRARLLALLGRHGDARAEVARADAYFAEHDPMTAPPWMTYYDAAEHAGSTARALTPLALEQRQLGEAADRLTTAIQLHSDAYPRSRAFSRARLATLTMRVGDPHAAVTIGRQALNDAASLHSKRMGDELKALRKAAQVHSAIPDVGDLVHELATAANGT